MLYLIYTTFLIIQIRLFKVVIILTQKERRLYIKKELDSSQKVEIKDLSNKLNVSEMTIRRDLKYLEEKGILEKVSKGAIVNPIKSTDSVDDTLNLRTHQNIEEKKVIAKYASTLINDGDIVCLDASTTVYEMCPYIVNKKNITLVTNSVRICNYFNNYKNVNVILAGGMLRYGTLSLIGADTIKFLRQYNTNKLFISGKALSYESGLTDINMFEIETKQAAMENASEIILLLDHTKLNKTSLIKTCDIKNISKVIIDGLKELSIEEQKTINFIKSNGVDVIIANDF